MKQKTVCGLEWDDEGPSLRFVLPFANMLIFLKTCRHIDRAFFKNFYSLTDMEFNDLVGEAEKFVRDERKQ